jgi:hypothetical protein
MERPERFNQTKTSSEALAKVEASNLSHIAVVLFFVVTAIGLISLSDFDGYEGDDLNSILPMLHLEAAKHGSLNIYRYAWQPLSYEVGAGIFQFTRTPTAIFLMAPIAGAISLALMLLITWQGRKSISTLISALVAISAVPEFWFSGLYYNSTIIGLPFALCSLAILNGRPQIRFAFLAGLLLAVAILMRLDFALAGPALTLTAWQTDRSLPRVIALTLGVLVVLSLAFSLGVFEPSQIVEIYRGTSEEIAAKSNTPGWDLRTKLGVISVILSPIGWAILLFGGPLVLYRSLRRNPMIFLLWVLAMLPLALPLPNLLSVKYVLPLAMFVPPFLMQCLSAIEDTLPHKLRLWPVWIAASGTAVLLLISVSVFGQPPYLEIGSLASRPVGTHDGYRSYGGYLWQAAALDRWAPRSEQQTAASLILNDFRRSVGPDILVAGDESFFAPGGIGWRHLQLELERSGVHGRLLAPQELQFDLNDRKLTLVRDLRPDTLKRFDRGRGISLIDLRGP